MHRASSGLMAIGWALGFVAAAAQSAPPCDKMPRLEIPAGDRPTLAQAMSATGMQPVEIDSTDAKPVKTHERFCSGLELYYGDATDHLRKARYCVLGTLGMLAGNVDKAQIKAVQAATSGGATDPEIIGEDDGLVLAMVYANGEGVKRNLPLAESLVCSYAGGPAGFPADTLLKNFRSEIESGKRYDICNGGGDFSRGTNYACFGIQEMLLTVGVKRDEAAIAMDATPEIKAALTALQAAWKRLNDAYVERVERECGGGNGCGVMVEESSVELGKPWAAAVKEARAGLAPARNSEAGALAGLDLRLNQKYQALLQNYRADGEPEDKAQLTALRAEERAWIVYRDRWVAFGMVRWPETSADQWRAWATAVRVKDFASSP